MKKESRRPKQHAKLQHMQQLKSVIHFILCNLLSDMLKMCRIPDLILFQIKKITVLQEYPYICEHPTILRSFCVIAFLTTFGSAIVVVKNVRKLPEYIFGALVG